MTGDEVLGATSIFSELSPVAQSNCFEPADKLGLKGKHMGAWSLKLILHSWAHPPTTFGPYAPH